MLFYPAQHRPVNDSRYSGRYLAHNCLTHVERAFVAADLVTGAAQLVMPTGVQAAWLARVNRTYAGWAVKQMSLRSDIIGGALPLVPPKSQSANGCALPAIADADISDEEIVAYVLRVGISRTLEAAVRVESGMHA